MVQYGTGAIRCAIAPYAPYAIKGFRGFIAPLTLASCRMSALITLGPALNQTLAIAAGGAIGDYAATDNGAAGGTADIELNFSV